jgi:hypothetical protein
VIFRLLYHLEPPSLFGLPEEGKTVLPAGSEWIGPVVDRLSGNLVSHGTMSHYRPPDQAIDLSYSLGMASLTIHDNFFTLSLDAKTSEEAEEAGNRLFDRFVRQLTVQHGELFRYSLLQMENAEGAPQGLQTQRTLDLGRVRWYDLDQVAGRLLRAAARSRLEDPGLERALVYYEHACFLFNMRGYAAPLSKHHAMMLTSAFLHLWKAITVILGDPSVDRDHQSRFKRFGLPCGFWKNEVDPLKGVRDSCDVAHYSLSAEAEKEVERAFGRADLVCRRAIAAYSEHLLGLGRGRPSADDKRADAVETHGT